MKSIKKRRTVKMSGVANQQMELTKQKQREVELRKAFDYAKDSEFISNDTTIETILRVDEILKSFDKKQTVMEDNPTVITAKDKFKPKSKFIPMADFNETYKTLNDGFFKPLIDMTPDTIGLKKVRSGSELIKDVILYNDMTYSFTENNATQNLAQLKNVQQKIKDSNRIFVHDTETLGGINQYGRRTLDWMTEFYGADFINEHGKIKIENEHNGLIGLPQRFEDEYKEIIRKYHQYGKLDSDREAVIINRLGLYGHKDTIFGFDNEGNKIIKQFADPSKGYKYTQAELLEGLGRLRETWDYNQSEAMKGETGLQRWQETYASYLKRLQDNSIVKIDQNGGLADTPWNNAMIHMEELNNPVFRKLAGLDETLTLNTDPNNHGDTLSAGRLGFDGKNIKEIYNTPEKQRMRSKSQKGPLALENISDAILEDNDITRNMGAHTAPKDSYQTARLIFEEVSQFKNENGKNISFFDKAIELAERDRSKISGVVNGGGQELFFSPYTVQGGAGKKGYMSFIYDSLNNAARTTGGANVGDVIKQDSFGQFPIRKNSFYTLEWSGQVALEDEWRKKIAKNFPEFNQGSLYVAKFSQVLDESIATADTRHNNFSYLVAESREELESYISRLAMVGKKDADGNWKMLEGHEEEITNLLSVSQIRPDGKHLPLKSTDVINDAIKTATEYEYNDKAARTAREFELTTYQRFEKFKSLIEEVNGGAATREQVNDIAKRLLNGEEIAIANEVAKGKSITLDTLKNTLGWKDIKTNKQEWYSETVNKMLTSYEYFDSMMPIANEVLTQIGDGANPKDKAYRFQYAMKEIMNKIAVDLKEQDPKLAFSNTEAKKMFTKDTNRFIMDVSDVFDSKIEQYIDTIQGIRNANEISINLNDKNGSGLINSILEKEGIKYESIPEANKNQKSLEALKKFVRNAGDKKQYKEIFDGMELETYKDSLMLSRDIMGRLIDARSSNPQIGMPNAEYIFDAINPRNFAKTKYLQEEGLLSNTVKDILSKAPSYMVIENQDINGWAQHAEQLISHQNEHLFKGFNFNGKSFNSVQDLASAMGYNKFDQQYLGKMYNQVQEEYKTFLTGLLSNLGQVDGGEIIYDSKNIAFRVKDQYTTLKLPTINFENGQFSLQLGGNKVALHNVIDIDGVLDNNNYADLSKVKISTNFKKAIEEIHPKGLEKYLSKGKTPFQWINSIESSIQRNITSGSPGFTDSNLTELEKSFHLRDSEIKKLLPYMKKQGVLNHLDRNFVDKIKDNMDYMDSEVNQLYQANRAELIKVLAKYNPDLNPIAENVSSMVKANDIGDYIKVGGTRSNALIQLQDFRRDVPGQERAIMFDKDYVKKMLPKLSNDAKIGSYVNTNVSSKLRNRKMGGVVNTGIDITMNNLNMSDPMLREMVLRVQSDEKFVNSLGENTYKKVVDKLKDMSLVEGTAILDPRVADAAFYYSDVQRVAMDKLLTDMNNDINTIKQKERYAKLLPTFKMVDGKMTVELSRGTQIKRGEIIPIEQNGAVGAKLANHDGTLNIGWFIEGTDIELDQKQINKVIANARSEQEAIKILNSKYKGYATVKYDHLPDYIKTIQDGGEKNMTYIPRFGVGELDDNIMAYMMATGQSDKIGKVVDYKNRQDIIRFDKDVAAEFGFSSEKSFWKAFDNERYKAMDVLKDVVRESAGDSNIDFSIISSNGLAKHGNFGSIFRHNINAMVEAKTKSIGNETKAMEYVLDQLKTGIDGKSALIGMDVQIKGNEFIFDETLGTDSAINIEVMKSIIDSDDDYKDIGKQLTTKIQVGEEEVDISIGTISRASISQVKDYQNVTGKEQTMQAVRSLEREADDLLAKAMKETKDPVAKATMLREADALREQAMLIQQAVKGADKGRRISDRDMLMYSYDKLTDGYIKDLRSSIGNDETFLSLAGDLLEKDENGYVKTKNGEYKLKEDLVGTSANKHLLEERRKSFYRGNEGDRILRKGEDLSEYLDNSVREGIERIVNKKETIRKDLAEAAYAMHQGGRVQNFRQGKHSVDEMKEVFGFNVVDINELSPHLKDGAQEMIENETAALGKNIMIDLGDNFGDVSNHKRYVAMPYMPVKRIQDDVIRADYERKISGVLNAVAEFDKFGTVRNDTGKSREELMANIRNKVDEYYQAMDYHLVSKDGMFGTYSSFRIAGQSSTKTQTGTYYTPDEMKKFFNSDSKLYNLVESWSGRIDAKDLEKINYSGFSIAKFDGKTLLEHAQEGRMINAKFHSLEAFEKMGMFNKDVMEQFGFKTNEEMINHLTEYGVLGEVTRTPNIKTGSSTRSMLYLDRKLQGNRAVVTGENQLGMVGDNDGDFSISNILTYKDDNNKDIMYNAKKSLSEVTDAKERQLWTEAQRSIYYHSTITNQHWRESLLNTLEKEQKNAINGSTLDSIMEASHNGLILPEFATLDQGKEAIKHLDNLSSLEKMLTENGFDFEKQSYADLDNWITDNILDESLANDYKQAVIFDIKHGKAQNTGMSKMLRSAIGEANLPMHKARQNMYLSLLHTTVDDVKTSKVLQKNFEDIEQDIISYKKIDKMTDATDRVVDFKRALFKMTSGKTNAISEGRDEMENWIDTYATSTLEETAKQLSRESDFEDWRIDWTSEKDLRKTNMSEEAIQEILDNQARVRNEVKEQFLNGLESIDGTRLQVAKEASRLGTASNAATASNTAMGSILERMYEGAGVTYSEELIDSINAAAPEGYESVVETIEKSHYLQPKIKGTMDDGLNYARQNTANTVKSILEDTGSKINHYLDDAMKNLTKSKFGAGALAFGTMFMLTGYMGGKPSQPAMEQSTNMAANEQGPMLSDFNMPGQSPVRQTNSGYVINIKGKGSPVAVEQSLTQIQRTAHSSFTTDVNVSMNITQSPGNIDDRTIEQMISDAIG